MEIVVELVAHTRGDERQTNTDISMVVIMTDVVDIYIMQEKDRDLTPRD